MTYQAFMTGEAGPDRLGQIFAQVTALLVTGDLTPPPVRCWDVRNAPEAFRFMSQARHTGKLVLTIPPDPAAPRQPGTALVTGGTGTLGALVAGHLAVTGRARELVLASRSGPAGPRRRRTLAAGLAASGATARITACDTASRDALAALLARIPAEAPLTVVVHAAGVLDDGVTESLTPDRVDAVMRPKADAAWHLHELTAPADLDAFVLFSAAAATFGGPGQGSYAAANAFLDGLAAARRAAGLPAVSLAWGLWADASAMTGHLAQGDLTRMARGGVGALSAARGLALLDAALGRPEALLVPARLDVAGLRARAGRGEEVPALWRGLTGVRARTGTAARDTAGGAGSASLRGQLAGLPAAERDRVLVGLVRGHAAAVLGHGSAEAIEPGRAFSEAGFDSLTAVELRNRLHAATGLRLPATLVFDFPTPVALAARLRAGLLGERQERPRAAAPAAAPGEPVAIVAMGCRFPGGVTSPDELWELLAAGGDAISEFPADRGWDTEELFDPDPDHPGTSYVSRGGFVTGAAEFDAGFFGISPREALAMDPQQRLLLEVCWEAIERAGIDPASLRGHPAGVFVGATSAGYGAGLDGMEGHLLTGTAVSVLSGRVSYLLGLEGPAVTVDTACSSSLVALHLACQSLRAGECDLALAGGVMIMATPGGFTAFSRQRGLAADGRCKAFSAAADGMGMAEGAGIVVAERLSDARRHGHQVLAVIRGSAINQDGASNGLTAPNGPSQQRVIRAALAAAGLRPGEVDAVEAHGTGTTLGDPIEAQALIATYGQDRPPDRPLWLGSVKSNLGHTQTAAGVAGVIKMVLALRHGVLPPTLHAREPSPEVDWTAGQVRLLTEPVPWPADGRPRRAGVSSFGFSGTNAHAILEEDDPARAEPTGAGPAGDRPAEGVSSPRVPGLRGALAWPVSARTAAGLRAQAGRLAAHVAARPDLDPAGVGWSLATTRSAFEHRAVVTGTDREELAAGLAALAAGEPAPGLITGTAGASGDGDRVVFVFPGQGGQWAGMGRDLATASPVFAARLAECGRALAPFTGWDLEQVLADGELSDRADVVQPALWAVMVSLAAAWQAAGITPDAVVGHSQGEIAAAVVAGILSLEDGARVVALRSKALTALAVKGDGEVGGGMVSVAEAAEAVRDRIAAWGERLAVAAVNGPAATVVCGESAALEELAAACESDGIRARPVPVDYASHGPQVEAIRPEILAALAPVTPGPAAVPMVSAMTGEWLEGPEAGAGYWYDSLRAPVEFARAVRALTGAGHRMFVEVSPHPVLTAAITETTEAAASAPGQPAPVVTGTLRRDDGGPRRWLAALAAAHVHGARVDWAAVLGRGERVDLPTYAFQHQRFWPEPPRRPERVEGWRYRVSWLPAAGSAAAALSGTWLVVAPAGGELAAECAAALASRGARVMVVAVPPGETGRAALAARIEGARAQAPRVSGVVSLLGLDVTPLPGHPVVPAGVAATLGLVQALGDAGVAGRLWVVTRGAVAAGEPRTLTEPVQAMLWGLGLAAGLEHPDRWGGLVDLPPDWDERVADRLGEVLAGAGEDQVAIRPAAILARRLLRAPQSEPDGRAEPNGRGWAPSGTVLVTGGTGAVGGHVARWLAAAGAGHVALASRSGPGAAGAAALAAELAELGTRVSVTGCDLADRVAVAGLLDRIRSARDTGEPPLTGVFHAAGVLDDGVLDRLDAERLAGVLGVKAAGARWLHELTEDAELGAFVLFSSAAAVLGSAGQGNYAAANAYLDALAQARRRRGLAGLSVAWGPWGGGGLASQSAVRRRMRRGGLPEMAPHLAVRALEQALERGDVTLAVLDADWSRLASGPGADGVPSLLRELPEAAAAARPAEDRPGGELARRLAGRPEAEQDAMLTGVIRAEAAAVLGHASAEAVEPGRVFRDLGFDSLTAVELRNRLAAITALRLPATLVFDYPTPVAMAARLRTMLLGGPDSVTRAPAVRVADTEPVALVGMGCRYPGGVDGPEDLWDLLTAGGDAISDLPGDRGWDVARLYDPDPDHAGTSYTRRGGFLRDAAGFDPGFFGISPREALAMDPQQRLLLEVSWEAIERAGIDPGRAARLPDRHLRGGGLLGVRRRARRSLPLRGLPADRHRVRGDLRPGVVRARPGGTRRIGGHGVLVLAGGAAPGLPVAAVGRV